MKPIQWLAAPLIAALICSPVLATCGVVQKRRVVVANAVVTNKVVVAEVVAVAVFQPVVVSVPAYGAAYVPTPAPTPAVAPAVSADGAAILAAIKGVRADIADLKVRVRRIEVTGTVTPTPTPTPTPPPVVPPPVMPKAAEDSEGTSGKEAAAPKVTSGAIAIFQGKCAGCHEAKVAGKRGGDFVMFEGGNLAKLKDRQVLRIGTRTYTGTMPPKKTGIVLSDEDIAVIQAWIADRE